MPRVRHVAVIEAPIDAVWSALRDFNGHRHWHPAIADSEIEGYAPPDQVGCIRRFALRDGGQVREQLLALSDHEHRLRSCILSATLPLHDYVAELQLRPVTDAATTLCLWEARFRTPDMHRAHMTEFVARRLYAAGVEGLRAHLAGPGRDVARVDRPGVMAGDTWAVVVTAYGGPEVLSWQPWPVPSPGSGEVRVKHTAIGVNYIDIYARTGRFQLIKPPGVPGLEGVGIVTELGAGVAGLQIGQRVGYAGLPPGAYATERIIAAEQLLPLPDDLDDHRAAAGLLKGMTASFLLHEVHRLRSGETVVIHAASGATGSLLAQWASALGATVIGIVGAAQKRRFAQAQGCAHVLLAADDPASGVRALTQGRGADVVFDGVGGDTFRISYEMLAERGHLVSFGQAAGEIPPVDIAAFAAKSARVSRPNFAHYTATPQQRRVVAERFFAALRERLLRIAEPRVLPLREAAQAHADLQSRRTSGATVLVP